MTNIYMCTYTIHVKLLFARRVGKGVIERWRHPQTYINVNTYTHTHIHIRMHTHTLIPTHEYMCVYIFTQPVKSFLHLEYARASERWRPPHKYMHEHTLSHTHTYTYKYPLTQTYIYMYMCMYTLRVKLLFALRIRQSVTK